MKKFLKFLPLVPVVGGTVFLTVSYLKAHPQPYPEIKPDVPVPGYTEIDLPHQHNYNGKKFLPVLGSAAIDVDGDGVSEVFLGGGENQDDALYKYTADGFEQLNEYSFGKGSDDATYGAAVVDLNNDQRNDLLVARESGAYIYMNTGNGFEGSNMNLPLNEKSRALSFAVGDINSDGYLDLYVSAYLTRSAMEGQNIFRKGYGATSIMMLNNGDNTFTDITEQSGLHYVHNTFLGIFVDMDDDRDLDIVVAHDTGKVRIWENNGDVTFTEIKTPYSDVYGYPMGIGMGDYNNDGRVDFYFSNVGPTAPHFLARGDLTDEQVFYTKLMLMENQGDMKFRDASVDAKVADYEFSWGITMADLNIDGLQDILISENYVSLPFEKAFKLPGRMLQQRSDNTYAAVEETAGVVNRNYEIAPLLADFNGDGYADQIRVNLAGTSRAFISKGGDNRFVKVKMAPTAELFGSKVQVVLEDGSRLTDWHAAGEGLCSDQEHTLIFGLGTDKKANQVIVSLPSGGEIVRDIPANTTLIDIAGASL